jgi:putative oxidoreductase
VSPGGVAGFAAIVDHAGRRRGPARPEGGVLVDPIDLSLLVLRLAVGGVMLAHGWNHIFRGGRIAGTGRWFESLGMRPGWLHAWTASLTELGAGALLVLGLFTPLAGAAVVGVMLVAWITNHRKNGFFVFRPGEGWEYVMTLTAAGLLFCGAGAGRVSFDHALDIDDFGWATAASCMGIGIAGALGLLVLFWRPGRVVR